MSKFLFSIFLVLGLTSNVKAAWQFHKYDCESPASYVTGNAAGLSLIVTQFAPVFATMDTFLPFAKPQADVNYIGIGVGVLKGFLQIGVTPVGTLNCFLHFACSELVNVEP